MNGITLISTVVLEGFTELSEFIEWCRGIEDGRCKVDILLPATGNQTTLIINRLRIHESPTLLNQEVEKK